MILRRFGYTFSFAFLAGIKHRDFPVVLTADNDFLSLLLCFDQFLSQIVYLSDRICHSIKKHSVLFHCNLCHHGSVPHTKKAYSRSHTPEKHIASFLPQNRSSLRKVYELKHMFFPKRKNIHLTQRKIFGFVAL